MQFYTMQQPVLNAQNQNIAKVNVANNTNATITKQTEQNVNPQTLAEIMTLMDVFDNRYYDVNKQKFMNIAVPSQRYPFVVQSGNVIATPIDYSAAIRLQQQQQTVPTQKKTTPVQTQKVAQKKQQPASRK